MGMQVDRDLATLMKSLPRLLLLQGAGAPGTW